LNWRNNFPDYKRRFIKDGIINENFYEKESLKLLFITKEANDKSGTLEDFRIHWNKPLNFSFDYRIAELAFGIQNNFPPFDSIYSNLIKKKKDQYENALKKIAFMDVKKNCGKSKCDHKALHKNIDSNLHFIHQQIDIINPDIIVSCLVEIELVNTLFESPTFISSGYVRCIFKWKKYKVIDFYHPSGQSVPAAMYCLMQNIYSSKEFKSL
jgi:hypothetical protein